jgi:hypothetical protein
MDINGIAAALCIGENSRARNEKNGKCQIYGYPKRQSSKISTTYQKNLERQLKTEWKVHLFATVTIPSSYSHGGMTPNVSYNYHLFKVQNFP